MRKSRPRNLYDGLGQKAQQQWRCALDSRTLASAAVWGTACCTVLSSCLLSIAISGLLPAFKRYHLVVLWCWVLEIWRERLKLTFRVFKGKNELYLTSPSPYLTSNNLKDINPRAVEEVVGLQNSSCLLSTFHIS
jgi:hypothetical protein